MKKYIIVLTVEDDGTTHTQTRELSQEEIYKHEGMVFVFFEQDKNVAK